MMTMGLERESVPQRCEQVICRANRQQAGEPAAHVGGGLAAGEPPPGQQRNAALPSAGPPGRRFGTIAKRDHGPWRRAEPGSPVQCPGPFVPWRADDRDLVRTSEEG